MTLDVFAYDLNVPDIEKRLVALGPRLLIIIDDSSDNNGQGVVTGHGATGSAESAAEYGSPDVRQTSFHAFDLAQVRQLGPAAAARQGLAALEAKGVEGFWIHLDADVLNDEVMPAVDYRMPDGLWPEELSEALAVVLASPLAVGMEVTIYNPTLDPDGAGARGLTKVIGDALV